MFLVAAGGVAWVYAGMIAQERWRRLRCRDFNEKWNKYLRHNFRLNTSSVVLNKKNSTYFFYLAINSNERICCFFKRINLKYQKDNNLELHLP